MSALTAKKDARFGYYRLEQARNRADQHDYVAEGYFKDVTAGGKSIDMARTLSGGNAADAQQEWLKATLYGDIVWAINHHAVTDTAGAKRVVDLGCGLGDLLAHMAEQGFAAEGNDLATTAVKAARRRGLTVHEGPMEALIGNTITPETFDAVTMVGLMEQVPDPLEALGTAYRLLKPGGVVVIRSGNQFNPLQLALRDRFAYDDFWLSDDHLSYFDFDSLARLMEHAELPCIYRQSDFPMEMLALMGLDYVGDKGLGAVAHQHRVAFETNTPAPTRRRLYGAFAAAGIGRCVFMVGRKAIAD